VITTLCVIPNIFFYQIPFPLLVADLKLGLRVQVRGVRWVIKKRKDAR
jgi:hypothetical protein